MVQYYKIREVILLLFLGKKKCDVPVVTFLMIKWDKGGLEYGIYGNMYLSGQAAKSGGV